MPRSLNINQQTRYELNNGQKIPVIGYGIYDVPKQKATELVYQALKAGYRHVDSAVWYDNQKEAAIGIAKFLQETGVKREEVWFTTKLTDYQQGRVETEKALADIADDVKQHIGYVDLVLLHSPQTSPEKRKETWKVLESAVLDPQSAPIPVKSIGVSNFGIKHLQEILAIARVKPVVDQLELHPWLPRTELRKYLSENQILAEAYSPLTQGFKLDDPELLQLEAESGISKIKILLSWAFLQGFIVLVKSEKPQRIVENLQILPELDSSSISISDELWEKLDKPESHVVVTWNNKDPTLYTP